MKKVFQTIVDKGRGNCAQAAIASLLDKELDDVPNFIENHSNNVNDHTSHVMLYLWYIGYDNATTIVSYSNRIKESKYSLKDIGYIDGGVNGYFYASVPSQTFEGVSHAVIVDKDMNIVHDPNPNQKALKLTENDINYIFCVNDWYISKEGEIIYGKNYIKEGIKII